jgi:hypothetical protein
VDRFGQCGRECSAQIELTNPEKSLIGTIEPQRGQGESMS